MLENIFGSSNKKTQQNKKHKKEFCRTKSPEYGDLHHQGVTRNEFGALSSLTHYLSVIHV